jgi:VanZ family protein
LTLDQKNLLKTWIAAILWLGIILTESTDYGSAEYTGRFLYPFLHFLLGVTQAHFPVWQSIIRKTGHFIGYFTLSLLLFRAWRATFPSPGACWAMQWARISFFMTALVACLDEWHQTYLPSRTGTLHDVLLDSVAALVAQIVLFAILRSRRQKAVASRTPAQV